MSARSRPVAYLKAVPQRLSDAEKQRREAERKLFVDGSRHGAVAWFVVGLLAGALLVVGALKAGIAPG